MSRRLFEPVSVGPYRLSHRIVMAPLTRMRSGPGDMPNGLMAEYYSQRASDEGLMIAEATSVSLRGRAYYGAPGIYDEMQARAWMRVTSAIHAKGSRVFLQLWHGGRQSHRENEPYNELPIGPSALPGAGSAATPGGWKAVGTPRALETAEVAGIVEDFRRAARRAMEAGFDGVEIHAANGYLPDQFLQDGSNHRQDQYGGTIENRARFLLEVTKAAAGEAGSNRVAVRISPSSTFNGMRDSDPTATFAYVARELDKLELAYLHVIEPRVSGDGAIEVQGSPIAAASLRRFYRGIIVVAGGFSADSAESIVQSGDADLVAFGRSFIANPDLPKRLREGLALNPYHRESFYGGDERGYIDYPFYESSSVREEAATG